MTLNFLTQPIKLRLNSPFRFDAPIDESAPAFTVGEFFFYLAFSALCLWQGIQTTNFENILFLKVSTFKSVMQAVCFACLAIKLFLDSPTFKSGLLGFAVGVILAISYIKCKTGVLFVAFAFVFSGKGVNFRRLALIAMVVYGVLLFFTVSSALSGQIAIVETVRSGGQVRSSLGFTHPNRLSTTIFQILVSWLVLRYPKFNAFDLVICIASTCPILIIADSRTTALTVLVMVILIQFAMVFERRGKSRLFIVFCGTLILCLIAVSIYFMFCYDNSNSFHKLLNTALTGRFTLARGYCSTYPPGLFGRSFSSDTSYVFVTGGQHTGIVVDNTYARIPILYGIVPTLVLFFGLCVLFIKEYKRGSIRCEFLFLVVFLIAGFAESFVLNLSMDIALMSFTTLFVSSHPNDGLVKRESTESAAL